MNKKPIRAQREQMLCLAMSILIDESMALPESVFDELMNLLNNLTNGRIKAQSQINILKILNK